jgi:hypothetical protein
MSEQSWAGLSARSVARFVTRRSPLGLSDTDLAIALLALAAMIVSALSESSSCCVRGLTLAGLVAASWLPLLLTVRLPLTALVLVTAVEIIYMVHVPLAQRCSSTPSPWR